MWSGAAGVGTERDPRRAPRRAWEPPTRPAGDKGMFPPRFAMPLEEMQPLITRRLKWRTRLPAEVTNSDRSDAVAMVTMVSWETPKGCHGIPSPIPLGPCSSRKKPFQMVPAPPSHKTSWLCTPLLVPVLLLLPCAQQSIHRQQAPPDPPVPHLGTEIWAWRFILLHREPPQTQWDLAPSKLGRGTSAAL